MKRHRENRIQFGPSVRLYLDDICEIAQIISEASGGLTISDSESTFDSIEELVKNRGKQPLAVSLQGKLRPIGFMFRGWRPHGVVIYGSPDEEGEQAFLKLQDVLSRRRRIVSVLFSTTTANCFALFAFGLILLEHFKGWRVANALSMSTLFFVALLLIVLCAYASRGFFSTLDLLLKHESTTFWSRNGEVLIISLVSAILGAILGIIGTLFANWLE